MTTTNVNITLSTTLDLVYNRNHNDFLNLDRYCLIMIRTL